ncbi:hypothetical protein MHU86_19460 [Fragilaria crotonensis]|nr:hypothetical protein MHU86_19460 [Fragilaria crotonensis]
MILGRRCLGFLFFKLLLEWRSEAHRGKSSQLQLTEQFSTFIERAPPANPAGTGRSKSKSRRTNATPSTSGEGGDKGTSSPDNAGDSADQTEEPQRQRIRLQKSRRVVTERSA